MSASHDAGAGATTSTLATARGDLDGDGRDEVVQLLSNGVLTVDGSASTMARIAGFRAPDSPMAERAPRVEIVDVDRRDRFREVLVTRFIDDEDPPPVYSFWAYRDGMLHAMLARNGHGQEVVGAALRIPGDGSVAFDHSRCVRDSDGRSPLSGIREASSFRYALSDGSFTRSDLVESISRTRSRADCIESACPIVRVEDGRVVGEVLRNLRGARLAAWQRLRLAPSDVDADGVLRLELLEQKREVTRLDGIYVVADGRRISADHCGSGSLLVACRPDAARITLHQGDAVRFEFRVGRVQQLEVWAHGYYEPLVSGGSSMFEESSR